MLVPDDPHPSSQKILVTLGFSPVGENVNVEAVDPPDVAVYNLGGGRDGVGGRRRTVVILARHRDSGSHSRDDRSVRAHGT